MGDVLQPMLPEIPEGGSLGKGVLHQRPGGVGDDDLPAVGRVGDPSGPVHVDADVVVPSQDTLPGVHAHPHPQQRTGGPVVGGQAALSCHRRPHRPHGAAEHQEEGISVGADLHPAAVGDRPANDRGVFVADRRVPITELLQQPGGALDVGEQEGDRPGLKLCHGERQCSASAVGEGVMRRVHRDDRKLPVSGELPGTGGRRASRGAAP